MAQFILSYWWIIVVAIILVGFITRSLIKLIITLVVFAVFFVIFWQVFVSPGFPKIDQCVSSDVEISNSINYEAKLMEPGIGRNEYICSESSNSFMSFTDCLYNAKQQNELSFMIYIKIFNVGKKVSEVIRSHSEKCPGYSFVIPDFLDKY